MSNIYNVSVIENKIERIAADNGGEIPDELLKELVEAQTKSLDGVKRMVEYVTDGELFISNCKAEEARIKNIREKAGNRIDSIKKYMTPFVKEKKKLDVGTFKLSTRKSVKVIVSDNWTNPKYMTEKTEFKINKTLLKADLKAGKEIDGASLASYDNLQIK